VVAGLVSVAFTTKILRSRESVDPLAPERFSSMRAYVTALVAAGLPEAEIRGRVRAERAHQERLCADAERERREFDLSELGVDAAGAAVDRVMRIEGLEESWPV
jgi:hypothetical protein